MNENEIIALAKTGDRAALTELVKKYESTIYNFSFKICRDKDKAENIMQETFLSMIKSLPQFDGNSKLSTWLYRIIVNHCLMAARKGSYNFVSLDDEDDDDLINEKYVADWSHLPFKDAEDKELRTVLDNSINKLSPDYRAVFLLRDVEGLSNDETSKILNISLAAVKSRLHRARAFLRNEINEAFKR